MFYVYTLVDPRDGAVFYVGKGKGDRLSQHEAEARKGKPGAKCERIRAIWADGVEVVRKRVAHFATETAALREEERLIREIGLRNLTNIAPGGRGGRHKRKPATWTDKMIAKIAPSLRSALKRMVEGDGRLYIGDHDITQHVFDLVSVVRREAGEEVLAKHVGAYLGEAERLHA